MQMNNRKTREPGRENQTGEPDRGTRHGDVLNVCKMQTLSTSPCLVPLSGSPCLVPLPGSPVWFPCLVPLPSSPAWFPCLVPLAWFPLPGFGLVLSSPNNHLICFLSTAYTCVRNYFLIFWYTS